MPHDLPADLTRPEPIKCQRCEGAGAAMCRLKGRKPSPLIVALCDRCSDHFLMLDCRTPDLDVLMAEAQRRLDEVEQLRQALGGRWRKKPAVRNLP